MTFRELYEAIPETIEVSGVVFQKMWHEQQHLGNLDLTYGIYYVNSQRIWLDMVPGWYQMVDMSLSPNTEVGDRTYLDTRMDIVRTSLAGLLRNRPPGGNYFVPMEELTLAIPYSKKRNVFEEAS